MQIAICMDDRNDLVPVVLSLDDLNDMHPDDIEAVFTDILVLDVSVKHPSVTRYDARGWAEQVRDDHSPMF